MVGSNSWPAGNSLILFGPWLLYAFKGLIYTLNPRKEGPSMYTASSTSLHPFQQRKNYEKNTFLIT